jgi:hypothetical protein
MFFKLIHLNKKGGIESESKISFNKKEMALKCDECDFIGKNEKSLRLHKIKKHKKK